MRNNFLTYALIFVFFLFGMYMIDYFGTNRNIITQNNTLIKENNDFVKLSTKAINNDDSISKVIIQNQDTIIKNQKIIIENQKIIINL